MALARLSWAFLRRDLQADGFWVWILEFLDILLMLIAWYGIARLAHFQNYFSFSIVGLAMSQYVWRGFDAFANRIKREQSAGSLELLWLSPYPFTALLILSSLRTFFSATMNAFFIFLVGTVGLGASFRWSGFLGVLGVGFLTCLAMGSLGLLASAWSIAYGRGDSFRPMLAKAIPLFCGAFFPVTLLPNWLQAVVQFIPLTHAMDLARGMLLGMAVEEGRAGAALVGLTLSLGLAGWMAVRWSVHLARMNGRLAAA